jgi:hypothetical protein
MQMNKQSDGNRHNHDAQDDGQFQKRSARVKYVKGGQWRWPKKILGVPGDQRES